MKGPKILFAVAALALVAWLLSLALFSELSSHDPYGWAEPGVESVESRSLYLERRDLYVRGGVASFVVAAAAGAAGLVVKRRARLR